jgi:hypothetical protein
MADPDTELLTPEDEEEQKRRQVAGSIGTPIARPGTVTTSPLPAPTINRANLPMVGEPMSERPPEMGSQPQPPVTISGTSQIPPYPTPEQSKAAAMEATPYHLPGHGFLHGLAKVGDTIAGMTTIGRAAEEAGHFGTFGHEATLAEQERKAAEEQGREKAAEGQQESQAKIGEQGALEAEHEAQTGKTEKETEQIGKMSSATVNGVTYQVPTKDLEKLIGTGLTNETKKATTEETNKTKEQIASEGNQTKKDINAATNESREKIAQWSNRSKEDVARIRGQFQTGSLKWGMLDGKPVLFDSKTAQIHDIGALQPQPTSQTRAMGEQGGAISFMVPPLLEQIDALKDEIGPFAGRFDRAYVNKLGANDPAFASLDEGLQFFASGVARAHFGARGAAAATSEFKKYLTQSQSVDDLKARIQAADGWMQNYAKLSGAANAGGGAGGGITIDRDAQGNIIGVH